MTVKTYVPEVNSAAEFREISRDFINPLEILREAIHNSLDAKASSIKITAQMKDLPEGERLVITIFDNGLGMTEEGIKKFFSLGFSNKPEADDDTIGNKGHGTKIYFNSEKIQVTTASHEGKWNCQI